MAHTENYTDPDMIVRGSRWPPAEDLVTVAILNAGGWPVDVEDWEWFLHLSRSPRGDPSDLVLDANTVALAANTVTLTFFATAAQTLQLPHIRQGEPRMFYVDVRSVDPDEADETSFYDCVSGFAWVRNYAGEGA